MERFGLTVGVLMENAGRSLAAAVLEEMEGRGDGTNWGVLVVCGSGNNGGDGLVAARHLRIAGVRVHIMLAFAGEPRQSHNAANLMAALAGGITVTRLVEGFGEEAAAGLETELRGGGLGLVIDAVLGTGLLRPPDGLALEAIRLIQRLGEAGWFIAAADVPSGIDADSGLPLGGADNFVSSGLTVCFATMKVGLAGSRCKAAGRVIVGNIGLPGVAAKMILNEGGER